MFSAPWLRHAKFGQPTSLTANSVDRCRSRSPIGQPRHASKCNKELAHRHAQILFACLPSATQSQFKDILSNGLAYTESLKEEFTNDVLLVLETIEWLAKASEITSEAEINWRFVTARIKLKSCSSPSLLHNALGCLASEVPGTWRRSGPTPSSNLKLLQARTSNHIEAQNILDGLFAARTSAAHSENTHATYGSHLNMIGWACEIIGCQPLPASISTIQRVICVVNDATTVRGWLAAWKLAHTLLGLDWAGDLDPRFRLIKQGMLRMSPPPLPNKRARAGDVISMVKWALSQDSRRWVLWGGMAALSYVYGFRVRSELLQQWRTIGAQFTLSSNDGNKTAVSYGPYRRKGKVHNTATIRGCLCESQKILCPHLWAKAFSELNITSAEGMSAAEFTDKLQECVSTVLSKDKVGYIRSWTTHVFRRGGAIDVLEAKGIKAMLEHGEWASERSSYSYARLDEIDTMRLRQVCESLPDLSDND